MKAELLILGVLQRGDFHPYEIKRRLSNAMVECFVDVDVGTLYYAIGQLARSGLISKVGSERVARGGLRTTYTLTARGRQRFDLLLHECFAAEGSVASTLYGAMLFLHRCDRERLKPLLEQRISRQQGALHELAAVRRSLRPVLGTGAQLLIRHLRAQRELDLRWTRRLLATISSGRIDDMPQPRRLAAKSGSRR